jgi:hypothetical protein
MSTWRSVVLCGAVLAAGCASMHESPDFERHRESRLTVPYERDDVLYFDVKLSPSLPDGDPAAEAKRMEWLQAWLDFRSLCPNGYEIAERRPFRFEEMNPGRFDLRYEVTCTTATAAG